MVKYRYLGYGVSNGNGVAVLDHDSEGNPLAHSYIGAGKGLVDFIASLDNPIDEEGLLSNSIEILDCIGADKGTIASHNDAIWSQASLQYITRDEEYSIFTRTGTSSQSAFATIDIVGDICIEFDIMSDVDPSTSKLISIRQGSTILTSVYRNDIGISANYFSHIKIDIIGNRCTITNTDNQRSVNRGVTGYDKFYLRVDANKKIWFKNFKYYPI